MPTPLIPQEIYVLERYSSKNYYLHAGRGGASVANVDAERLGAASPRAARPPNEAISLSRGTPSDLEPHDQAIQIDRQAGQVLAGGVGLMRASRGLHGKVADVDQVAVDFTRHLGLLL